MSREEDAAWAKLDAQCKALEAQCRAVQARGGRFVWHKWFATYPVHMSGSNYEGWACFEWLWRVRSMNDQIWWYVRVRDYPFGMDRCGYCGDGFPDSEYKMEYGTQPCLAEPDRAHRNCWMGYSKLSKDEYCQLQRESRETGRDMFKEKGVWNR